MPTNANYFAALDSDVESVEEAPAQNAPQKGAKGGAITGARTGGARRPTGTLNEDATTRPKRQDRPRGGRRGGRPRGAHGSAGKHGGFDRHSGTGRGREPRKGGYGGWGNENEESRRVAEVGEAEAALKAVEEAGREVDVEGKPTADAEGEEVEEKTMSYDDYLNQLNQKRQGDAFKSTEEAKVEFKPEGVKPVGKKTGEVVDEEFATLLGGEKKQKKTKEGPNVKNVVDLAQTGFRVARPEDDRPRREGRGGGRGGRGGRGRGRGRGGSRGGRGGARGEAPRQPKVGKEAFPSLKPRK